MADTPASLAAELAKLDTEILTANTAFINEMTAADTAAAERKAAASTKLTAALQPLFARQTDMVARVAALPVATTPPPPAGWTPAFPGDVKPGTIRWGAAIDGNGDPVARHETAAGVPMGVRRTFFDMGKVDKLVATAKDDIAKGRVPWVSVKLGATWADVAAGKIDTALLALFGKLKALPGPVWFTAHHEPEGGGSTPAGQTDDPGGAPAWRAMQARIRSVLDKSGATNVAFAPILMAWTFDTRSNRKPADWWVDGIWDFAGIDVYQETAGKGGPQATAGWKNAQAFYKGKGLRIAIGEWGNRGTDAVAAAEMTAFRDLLVSIGSPGVDYFDSGLNSPSGAWTLEGEPLARFRELMKAPTSVRL